MSAQVTEAHRELAYAILFATEDGHAGPNETAQPIADSEAKACAELRAVFPKILAALGNGAGCTPDVSVEFIQSIPSEVAGVVAQLRAEVAWWKNWHDENEKMEDGIAVKVQATIDGLRAEVERLKADGAASAFITMSCRASRAETERNNLRADLDAIKAILTEEKARAERAEAEVDQLKDELQDSEAALALNALRAERAEAELADCRCALADRRNERDHSQDTTHQLVAALDQALDIAQAELAAERAKVRTLRYACESIEEQWDKNHSANPFHAGNVMQSHAMRALAATEDAQ